MFVVLSSILTFLLLVVLLLFLDSDAGSIFGGISVDGDDELGVAGQGQDTVIVQPVLASSILLLLSELFEVV